MSPVGFQRSRALWDHCRDSFTNDRDDEHGTTTPRQNVLLWQRDTFNRYCRAILYEVQPIRYSVLVANFGDSYRYFSDACSKLIIWGRSWVPQTYQLLFNSIKSMTRDQWKWTIAIALYYVFLRWIHATLEAGPVVLILTALTIIFTVGLSDQTNMDGLSAYSVFNKGFQKIMGSIDADDLLQQHLGGGGIMQMMQRRHIDDDFDVNDEPPQRRRPRQQHNNQQRVDININNNAHGDNEVPVADNNNINQNRARRTGKKARRDRAAIEQRREIRAQRDAALAMGFGHINDDDVVAGIVDDHGDAGLDDVN